MCRYYHISVNKQMYTMFKIQCSKPCRFATGTVTHHISFLLYLKKYLYTLLSSSFFSRLLASSPEISSPAYSSKKEFFAFASRRKTPLPVHTTTTVIQSHVRCISATVLFRMFHHKTQHAVCCRQELNFFRISESVTKHMLGEHQSHKATIAKIALKG